MMNQEFIKEKTGQVSSIETKNFEIEILTPVHVGSGREYTKSLDFTTTDNHTILFNMDRLFREYKDEPEFLDAMEYGNIESFLDKKGAEQSKFHKITYPGKTEAGTLREFLILGYGKPVFPGSSLKGAIRTALFAHFFQNEAFPDYKYKKQLSHKKEWAGNRIEQRVLTGRLPKNRDGRPDFRKAPNYDIGRVLRTGDAEFSQESLEAVNVRVMNLTYPNGNSFNYGWKELAGARNTKDSFDQGTPVSVLAMAPGTTSLSFQMSLDMKVFDHINWEQGKIFDWMKLAEIMNHRARKILQYEYHFLNEVVIPDEDTGEMAAILREDVESKIPTNENDKPCWVQQVGWGTGWHSKTGLHIVDEDLKNFVRKKYRLGKKDHPIYPKSRKIVPEWDIDENEEFPALFMGWIKIQEI